MYWKHQWIWEMCLYSENTSLRISICIFMCIIKLYSSRGITGRWKYVRTFKLILIYVGYTIFILCELISRLYFVDKILCSYFIIYWYMIIYFPHFLNNIICYFNFNFSPNFYLIQSSVGHITCSSILWMKVNIMCNQQRPTFFFFAIRSYGRTTEFHFHLEESLLLALVFLGSCRQIPG